MAPRPQAGFSLVEVLAALAILAIAMAGLYGAFGTGLRTAGAADERLAATVLAQSILQQQTVGRSFKAGVTSGGQGRFAWQVLVEPAGEPLAPIDRQPAWLLLRLEVTVSWPPGRSLMLQTMHLGRLR